jgi:hypothetical protein
MRIRQTGWALCQKELAKKEGLGMKKSQLFQTGRSLSAGNQVRFLVEIGRALRENPWFFTVLLCTYLDGYFINTMIFGTSVSVWVLPELATGLIWVCLITAVVVAATREVVPPTRTAACYCMVASLVVATGALGVVVAGRATRSILGAMAEGIPELHAIDARWLVEAGSMAAAVALCALFFAIVIRALRKAIRSLARRPQSHDPDDRL